jgi:putative ABC transport system substrate-binding protein
MGWAQTLARPGGMITGLFEAGSASKRLELVKAVRPQATRFGYLLNATNPGAPLWALAAHDADRILGIKLAIIEVKDQSELADAFDRMGSLGVEALAVNPDPVLNGNGEMIAELARKHKLPTVFEGTFPAGGLLAFTNDYVYLARRSASYVAQILKGTAPGDLAMEQGNVYKLLVNLKTAKELGITIPPSVLARADEVID